MGRQRKQPTYDSEKTMKRLMDAVTESYEETGELKITAEEFSMSALKVRKLLITAGKYHNEISDEIGRLYAQGKSVQEIQEITGLRKSSVNGYLPYIKAVYKPDELSMNAQRITTFRDRQKAVKALLEIHSEEFLWDAVVAFQEYPFHTASGLPFSYMLKVGRNGTLNKELLVSRRQESKTLAWSSVRLAFEKALEKQGEFIERPKALGDIRGISYIYPMLYRFGIIDVPVKTAEKMQLKGGMYGRKNVSKEIAKEK